MLNRNTIMELYSIDFLELSSARPSTPEYDSANHKVDELKELLDNCVEPSTESIIEQYIAARDAIYDIDMSEAFANGFSIAVKLLLEALFGTK